MFLLNSMLTHLIYASVNRVIIGSGNGLSPFRRQAISQTNAHLLSVGPLGTYFSEIRNILQHFSFKKMYLERSSVKWRPFCPGGAELTMHTYPCSRKPAQRFHWVVGYVHQLVKKIWYPKLENKPAASIYSSNLSNPNQRYLNLRNFVFFEHC